MAQMNKPVKSEFLNMNLKSSTGNYLILALFVEHSKNPEVTPLFSQESDIPGVINMKKTFVELRDPTGVEWTKRYLNDDLKHFNRIVSSYELRGPFAEWQAEIHQRNLADALEQVRRIAMSDDKNALVAARYLAEEGWKQKETRRPGRPTKAEVDGELKAAAESKRVLSEDAKRMGLSVVAGGKL